MGNLALLRILCIQYVLEQFSLILVKIIPTSLNKIHVHQTTGVKNYGVW